MEIHKKRKLCKSHLSIKEQKVMFLVVSGLHELFGFFACLIGYGIKIARLKNRLWWSRFIQAYQKIENNIYLDSASYSLIQTILQ